MIFNLTPKWWKSVKYFFRFIIFHIFILKSLAIDRPLSFLPPPYHISLGPLSNFSNVNLPLTERHLAKNVWDTFVDFEICHQIVSLWKLYYAILTYILKGKFFKFYISETVRAGTKRSGRHLQTLTFAIERCHCENNSVCMHICIRMLIIIIMIIYISVGRTLIGQLVQFVQKVIPGTFKVSEAVKANNKQTQSDLPSVIFN